MTLLSGIACVFGASIICVDVIVRLFPGKKDFRIQDSDMFLSSSLSLSFGVMASPPFPLLAKPTLTMHASSSRRCIAYFRPRRAH